MATARKKRNTEVSTRGVKQKASKRKRRGKRKIALRIALVLIPACAIFITLSLTVLFRVVSFTVEGDLGPYTSEQIEAAGGISAGTNLFLADTDAAEKQIQTKLPYIETASVKIRLPDRIVIRVTQAVPVAAIETEKETLLINVNGKVLDTADDPGSVLLFLNARVSTAQVGATMAYEREDTAQVITAMIAAMQTVNLPEIKTVDLSDLYSMKLQYADLYEIRIGSIANLEKKLKYAEYLIRNHLDPEQPGTLDLSISIEQAVFRPDYDSGGVVVLPDQNNLSSEANSSAESQ